MIAAKCPKCGNIGCTGVFCGYKTVHKNAANINPFSVEEQVRQQLEEFKRKILKFETFDSLDDMGNTREENVYILLSDVLALFSAKKE